MARSASAMRGDILKSAGQLFAARGYRGTSLNDIASMAGCSKASLIYHFTSKDAILTELLAPARASLTELNAQLDGLEGDQAVEAAVTGYIDLALRFRLETKILFEDLLTMTSHPALSGVTDVAARLLDALAGRSTEPKNVVAAHMVVGAVFVTCSQELQMPDDTLRAELIRGALRTLGHTSH